MPQYAVIQCHPPSDCPISSKSSREWAKRALSEMDGVAKRLGVKFVVPYAHLDPAHKGLMLLDGPNAEAVRDFLIQGGFFHFLDNELYLVTPISELMRDIDKIPTAFP